MTIIAQEDFANALDRIARTSDGVLLYRWLQKELMAIPATDKSGALRAHHGRRSLAAQLMAMMAQGVAAGAGSDRPVVFQLAQSRRTSDSRAERAAARRGEPSAHPDAQ